MIEVSLKTLYWFAAGLGGLLVWFIRLESKGVNNKTKTDADMTAVNLKIDNHISAYKEKSTLIFVKLDKVTDELNETNIALAVITEHFKQGDR